MIHLNVWFSFKDASTEEAPLQRVRAFLSDLKDRRKVHEYRLLKSRSAPCEGLRSRFHALIMFHEDDDWGGSVREVQEIGIHAGLHGFMIEDVCEFTTAVYEELPELDPSH